MLDVTGTCRAVSHGRQLADHLTQGLQQLVQTCHAIEADVDRADFHLRFLQRLYQQRNQILDIEEIARLFAVAEQADRYALQCPLGEDAYHTRVR